MRLILIEDDSALAEGIAAALRQGGHLVDLAATGESVSRLVRASAYECGILDLGLPDMDGIDLLRQLRAEGYSFPVLILTARDGLDDRIRGLDSGADDYLVKPFALGELEARLRALLRRTANKLPWGQVGGLRFNLEANRVQVNGEEVEFTRREFSVLKALLQQAGKVVHKQTMFSSVLPDDTDAAPNAIEVYVSRVRRKVEPAGVVITALRGVGYRLDESRHAGSD